MFSNLHVNRRRNTQSCISKILPSDFGFTLFCTGFEQHLPIYLALSMLPCLQDMHIFLLFIIHSHYSLAHTQSRSPSEALKPVLGCIKMIVPICPYKHHTKLYLYCIYIVLTSTKLPSQQENIHPFTFLNKAYSLGELFFFKQCV